MTTEQTTKPLTVYFGTANRGKGILVYELDQATGRLTTRGETEIKGRGWLALDPTERFVYAATDPDRIDAFAVDRSTGLLTALNSSPTGTASVSRSGLSPACTGQHPCTNPFCLDALDDAESTGRVPRLRLRLRHL